MNLTTKELETKLRTNNFRAKSLNVEGIITLDDIASIFKSQKGKCYYCNCELDDWVIEHKDPISRDGNNEPSNICYACHTCNSAKTNKTEHEFLYKRQHVDIPMTYRQRCALDTEASKNNMSRAEFVRNLLYQVVPDYPPNDKTFGYE